MNNIFELKDLCFSYPDSEIVLDNVTLNIKSGESVAILGANGCGKSTLLKILSGLLYQTSGSFYAFDDEITPDKMKNDDYINLYHQKIGFIFQDSDVQLFCNTVQEELAFGLLQLMVSRDVVIKRIHEISELIGITHLLDKAPFKLSGGEKKKVAIAATLLLNPDVMILDEPTNALDPKTQHWLVEILRQLNQHGKTLIITTHNLHLVAELATRGILFNEQHEIIADAPIHDILQQDNLLREVNLIY